MLAFLRRLIYERFPRNIKPMSLRGNQNFMLAMVSCLIMTSCVPVEQLIYLQETELATEKEVFTHSFDDYQLQASDILDVKISSMNPEVNAIFNSTSIGSMQMAQASTQSGGDLYYMTGYTLSSEGLIDIPFVGEIQVLGMTLDEAHVAIDKKVKELFTNYHLQVKLGGVRFSTLGEFNRPGKHVVMQNRVTILEAIALSGDLSQVANRESVKLIRQHPGGTQIHTLNLLDQSIVESPFYFIQPNDVIYVEPLPQRSWGIGITGAQTFSTVVSTLSTSLALVLSIISLSR